MTSGGQVQKFGWNARGCEKNVESMYFRHAVSAEFKGENRSFSLCGVG